jgi:hypothetical protein
MALVSFTTDSEGQWLASEAPDASVTCRHERTHAYIQQTVSVQGESQPQNKDHKAGLLSWHMGHTAQPQDELVNVCAIQKTGPLCWRSGAGVYARKHWACMHTSSVAHRQQRQPHIP